MYPYIATIKPPSTINSALSLNIFHPQLRSNPQKQALVLHKCHSLELFQIQHSGQNCQAKKSSKLVQMASIPFFTQVLVMKRISLYFEQEGRQMRKDLLFIVTKDFWMHILDFSQEQKTLVPVSSFQIDAATNKRLLQGVLYCLYDWSSKAVCLLLSKDYALVINLGLKTSDINKSCPSSLEILNFTLTEVTDRSSNRLGRDQGDIVDRTLYQVVKLGRVEKNNEFLLALVYENQEMDQNELNDGRFPIEDHISPSSRSSYTVAICKVLSQQSQASMQAESLLEITYSKDLPPSSTYMIAKGLGDCDNERQSVLLFSTKAIFKYYFTIDKIEKLVEFDDHLVVEVFKPLSGGHSLLFTSTGNILFVHLNSPRDSGIQYSFANYQSVPFSVAASVVRLDEKVLFVTSNYQNHQVLQVEPSSQTIKILEQRENIGTISEIKRCQKSKEYVALSKSSMQSTLRFMSKAIPFEVDPQLTAQLSSVNTTQDAVVGLWELKLPSDTIVVVSTYDETSAFCIVINQQKATGKISFNHVSSKLISNQRTFAMKVLEDQRILQIAERSIRLLKSLDDTTPEAIQLPIPLVKAVIGSEFSILLDIHNQLHKFSHLDSTLQLLSQSDFFKKQEINQPALEVKDFELRRLQYPGQSKYQLLVVTRWNSSEIELYLNEGIEQNSSNFKVKLSDYLSFQNIQIELVKVVKLQERYYLLVALTNGFLLAFSLYESVLETLTKKHLQKEESILQEINLVRLANVFKVGTLIHSIYEDFLQQYLIVGSQEGKIVVIDDSSSTKKLKIGDLDIQNLEQILLPSCASYDESQLLTITYSSQEGLRAGFINSNSDSGLYSEALLYKDLTFYNKMVQKFEFIKEKNMLVMCVFDSFQQIDQESGIQLAGELLLVDSFTGKTLQSIPYRPKEFPSSISQVMLGDGSFLIIVGTSMLSEMPEFTPQQGGLYFYKLGTELELQFKTVENGAIYDIQVFNIHSQQCIAVAVNAFLKVYSLLPYLDGENKIAKLAEIQQQILIIKLKTYVDDDKVYILVADIMKSLTVYEMRGSGENYMLWLYSRDPYGQWCMEMQPLGPQLFLVTDSKSNLAVMKKRPIQMRRINNTLQTEDPKIFNIHASFWFGEQVTSIVPSLSQRYFSEIFQPTDAFLSPEYLQSLSLPLNQSFFNFETKLENLFMKYRESSVDQTLMMGTSDGGVYYVENVTPRAYFFLKALQESMQETIGTFGIHQHSKYRKSKGMNHDLDAEEEVVFLDGDFIELFLELPELNQIDLTDSALSKISTRQKSGDHKDEDIFDNLQLREARMLIEHMKQQHS